MTCRRLAVLLAGCLLLQAPMAHAAEDAISAQPAARTAVGSVQEEAEKAAAAYAEGRYATAAEIYQSIAREHGVSASLYYDLGAAQREAGQLGAAILSFERARWLAPGDREIAAALRVAREQAGAPPADERWWRRARDLASPDGWALVAGIALSLACAGTALLLLEPAWVVARRRAQGLLRAASALSAGALVVAALACASLASETAQAVVLSPDLALRIAPFAEAEPGAALSIGERVRVEQRHGDFLRVRADSERAGWVPAASVGAIAPRG